MNAKKFAAALAGGLVVGAFAVAVPAPASAEYDYAGYINALQDAGLMASPYGDGGSGHQFPTDSSALYTGMSVCRSIQQGQTQSAILDDLDSGEGMLMNASDAVIYNAANTTALAITLSKARRPINPDAPGVIGFGFPHHDDRG
jgi:hypothetical protein